MKPRTTALLAALTLASMGCATQQLADSPEFQRLTEPQKHLVLECEYEAKLAVRAPRAVSSGSLLAEYDMAGQRQELIKACVQARKHRLSDPPLERLS